MRQYLTPLTVRRYEKDNRTVDTSGVGGGDYRGDSNHLYSRTPTNTPSFRWILRGYSSSMGLRPTWTMNPSSKCVSLETAKRLLAAGFPQDTERWWQATYSHPLGYRCPDCKVGDEAPHPCGWHIASYDDGEQHFDIAAPDAQEIGELLPAVIGGRFFRQSKCVDGTWLVYYEANGIGAIVEWDGMIDVYYNNEAEARAACWLYLKENNLI